jgi:hypothetical protein
MSIRALLGVLHQMAGIVASTGAAWMRVIT